MLRCGLSLGVMAENAPLTCETREAENWHAWMRGSLVQLHPEGSDLRMNWLAERGNIVERRIMVMMLKGAAGPHSK